MSESLDEDHGPTTKPTTIIQAEPALISGVPPQAQYIIKHLEKEVNRWENATKEEKKKKKIWQEKYEAVKEELTQMKVDQQINEGKKPSGLNGFMETPAMKELMPFIGPSLGKLFEGLTNKIVPGGAAVGEGGDLAGNNELIAWISSLPEDVQQSINLLLMQLSKIENPQNVNMIVTRFLNLLQNGIAANQNYQRTGTN
jgi:hypothetical protein